MVFKKGFKPWNKGIKAPQIARAKLGKPRPDMIGHKWNIGRKHSEERKIEYGKSMKRFWDKNKNSEVILNRNKKISEKMTGKKKNYQVWNYVDGKAKNRERNRKETITNWCIANNIHRVPDGCMIHHIDQNPMNNSPNNLQLMDKIFHNQLHNEFKKMEVFN